MRISRFLLLVAVIGPLLTAAVRESFTLRLPTDNDALYTGEGAAFYQHTVRYFRGERTEPWRGGRYGFVRNPNETGGQVLYTRLHEGIDVRPLYRDETGEPRDSVRAISSGRVVHVSGDPRRSDYGRYVVVEHRWEGSPFFSLYAHLGSISADSGRAVEAGDALGVIGYSGRGLSRDRAHLHLEIGMLLNETFDPWYYDHFHDEPNYHGIYSGLNLAGLDAAALFLAHRDDPGFSIRSFVRSRPVAYTLAVPGGGELDLLDRYPWLAERFVLREAPSWHVSFTRTGVPVRVRARSEPVERPTLVGVEARTERRHLCVAAGYLDRTKDGCALTRTGRRYGELFAE